MWKAEVVCRELSDDRGEEARQAVDEEEGKSTGARVSQKYRISTRLCGSDPCWGGAGPDGCRRRRRSVRWIELGKM